MLFAAGHAKKDIPEAVHEAMLEALAALPPDALSRGEHTRQADHLGLHGDILRLSELRLREALAGQPSVAAEKTLLVLVGRGSSDSAATQEMFEFAAMCQRTAAAADVQTAFLAKASPGVAEVLDRAVAAGFQRVVVQPHLLFGGRLLTALRSLVASYAQRYVDTQWLMTNHLGPAPLLVSAVIDRIAELLPAARPAHGVAVELPERAPRPAAGGERQAAGAVG
jgi:sirohydrochlorin cobaltochelatase